LDDRPGVGLTAGGLPDIDWVEVPGGPFLYQYGERRELPTFLIARYPITHAQFQAFIEDGGYADRRWWQGLAEHPETPAEPQWSEPNHPRETVSWYEAMAFCAWLSARRGEAITLPTEEQWEKAARGMAGGAYPYPCDGYRSGYANIDELMDRHTFGRTTPVGIYPQGASPDGVLDLVGNVWEWCLNEYRRPAQIGKGGKESRVLRGGSWNHSLGNARASGRDKLRPYFRLVNVGIRVLVPHPL
jgi:formylglycine-generating enzyme required for sulfatase activity